MGLVRFLLAFAVVFTHARSAEKLGYSVMSGVTAVQCFYVISGFLITMVLNEKQAYSGLWNFYISRYLRLWPTYIVVAILAFFTWQYDFVLSGMPANAAPATIAFVIFSNIFLLFQDWFHFLQITPEGGLSFTADFIAGSRPMLWSFLMVPPAWTLGVELSFYAVAPFVCRTFAGAAGLFLAGLACRLLLTANGLTNDPWTYRFAPSEMMLFAAGALAYFVGRDFWPNHLSAARVIGFIGVGVMVFFYFQPELGFSWFDRPARHYIALNSAHVVLAMILAVGPMFYGIRSPIDRLVGDMSFPIYLCHYLWLRWWDRGIPDDLLLANVVVVGGTLLFATALMLLVVSPMERLRRGASNAGIALARTTPANHSSRWPVWRRPEA